MYEQDVYLGDFEWLLMPNDEIFEEINHLRLITEGNSYSFDAQINFFLACHKCYF